MQDSLPSVCSCGNQKPVKLACCPVRSKARHDLSQCVLPQRSANNLTPPPSQPGSPKQILSEDTLLSDAQSPQRPSEAAKALNQAFANDDSENEEPGSSTLIPTSCYRSPRASSGSSCPRRESSATSVPPTSRMPPSTRGFEDSVQSSGTATPDIRPWSPVYSPMAAGFARLSLDGKRPVEQTSARSTRSSFWLEAKMFSGPA